MIETKKRKKQRSGLKILLFINPGGQKKEEMFHFRVLMRIQFHCVPFYFLMERDHQLFLNLREKKMYIF